MTGALNLASNGLVVGTTQLVVSAGNVGIGTASPGQKLDVSGAIQATAFYYSSDLRLKTNVRKAPGLEAILALNGARFDWRDSGEHDIGLIAQEVEDVLPELVATHPATGFKSVKYGNMVGPLIEATKDLHGLYTRAAQDIRKNAAELKEQRFSNQQRVSELNEKLSQVISENRELRQQLQEIKQLLKKK